MKKVVCLLSLVILIVGSCTKYRNIPDKYPAQPIPPPPPAGVIAFGTLRINEYMCKGSYTTAQDTLGGSTAKWFELYNPTTAPVTLTPGLWYFTDTLGEPTKCAITTNTVTSSPYVVPAKGFLVICCPKSGSTTPSPNHFNANFSLSSTSGSIGVYYQASSTASVTPIDTLNYNYGSAGANNGQSYGRTTDGQSFYMNLTTPLTKVTCEYSNN